MQPPKKPAKTKKNRLPEFQEGAVATVAPIAAPTIYAPRSGIIVWIATTIVLGALIGYLLAHAAMTNVLAGAYPIDTRAITVAAPQQVASISAPHAGISPTISVVPGASITQAQYGPLYQTVASSSLQPAGAPDDLKSWKSYPLALQGTVGTVAVTSSQ